MTTETLQTEYVMTLRGTISLDGGTSINHMLIFGISNASIEGPEISGKVVSPAGDWIQVRPNGTWILDVRMNVDLDDGSKAYMNYNGIVCMTEELAAQVAEGKELTSDDIYFRSSPYIQTNSEKYSWLNDTLFVGKINSFHNGNVVYDIFKVL